MCVCVCSFRAPSCLSVALRPASRGVNKAVGREAHTIVSSTSGPDFGGAGLSLLRSGAPAPRRGSQAAFGQTLLVGPDLGEAGLKGVNRSPGASLVLRAESRLRSGGPEPSWALGPLGVSPVCRGTSGDQSLAGPQAEPQQL